MVHRALALFLDPGGCSFPPLPLLRSASLNDGFTGCPARTSQWNPLPNDMCISGSMVQTKTGPRNRHHHRRELRGYVVAGYIHSPDENSSILTYLPVCLRNGEGGGTSAIIFRVMLSKFGLHKSLLIYSGINAGLLLVAFFLIKDRPNIKASTLAKRREPIVWVDTSLFKSPIFWSMSLCLAITIL